MSTIGERLRETRKEFGMNQEQFAKELGISRGHVSNLEKGADNPSSSLVKLICAKFSIREQWLVDGIGRPFPERDMSTDQGVWDKYNERKAYFEAELRNVTGEDLIYMVEAFCYLTSTLKVKPGRLNPLEITAYRKTICSIIHELENLPIILNPRFIIPREENREDSD